LKKLKKSINKKAKYKLNKIEDFRYLNQSGCTTIDKMDDEEEFQKMKVFSSFFSLINFLYCFQNKIFKAAMKLLNFGDAQDSILGVLSAILHLGNIKFQKEENANDEAVKVTNTPGLIQFIWKKKS